jgi:hypothetical protein
MLGSTLVTPLDEVSSMVAVLCMMNSIGTISKRINVIDTIYMKVRFCNSAYVDAYVSVFQYMQMFVINILNWVDS